MAQSALIRLVSLLKIIGHNVAVCKDSPCFSASGICGNGALEVGDSLRVTLLLREYGTSLSHGTNVCGVDGKDAFESF